MPDTLELRLAARKLSAADHAGSIRSFYPYWDTQYRPILIEIVNAFPADRLDFKPHPRLMTAHQMILHIAEAERSWIHHVVEGGDDLEWVAPAPDPAQGWVAVHDAPDQAALIRLLEECHRPTQRWLDQPVAELARVYHHTTPAGRARSFTLHWILDHLQEHDLHHRAQLNVYLRLLGVEPPSI